MSVNNREVSGDVAATNNKKRELVVVADGQRMIKGGLSGYFD